MLAAGTLLRFLLAESTGLGVDESYAVAVARQFSLSYFDHPPLHFWLAGAIAKLAHSESAEVVRFPFVVCFAATTWLTYRIGARLFGEHAGAVAALLLNISAVFSVTTGGWVLPDGPLMLFMLASVAVIADILFEGHAVPRAGGVRRLGGCSRGPDTLPVGGRRAVRRPRDAVEVPRRVRARGDRSRSSLTSAPHRRWLARPGP